MSMRFFCHVCVEGSLNNRLSVRCLYSCLIYLICVCIYIHIYVYLIYIIYIYIYTHTHIFHRLWKHYRFSLVLHVFFISSPH